MDQDNANESQPLGIDYRNNIREVDAAYSNNFTIEPSVWDLKMLFGQLEKTPTDEVTIDWRSSITMPWAVAKLLCFYLEAHVAQHERQNGRIPVPLGMIPKDPTDDMDPNMRSDIARIKERLFGPSTEKA